MKLSEMFSGQTGVHELGLLKIKNDVFNWERRTPHFEQEKSMTLYLTNAQISAGINQISNFIVGKKIKAKSEDNYSREWLDAWIKQRYNLKKEITNLTKSYLINGEIAAEPVYRTELRDGIALPIVDNIFTITDTSRIFVNMNKDKYPDVDYVYRVPDTLRSAEYKGKSVKRYRLSYIKGMIIEPLDIYGIPMTTNELIFETYGFENTNGIYGRGLVSAMINDADILNQIMQNIGTLSRYRAVGKKVFTVGTKDQPGTPQDVEQLSKQLDGIDEDNKNVVINKPFEMKDLAFVGTYDSMKAEAEYLRQNIGAELVPNYYTQWAAANTYAASAKSQVPFELYLNNCKEDIITFLNNNVLKSLKQFNPKLAEDLSFEFEEVSLDSREDRITWGIQLYNSNVISLNEFRVIAGYKPVENGDIFKYQNVPTDAKVSMGMD
jgi:hypothetical protein